MSGGQGLQLPNLPEAQLSPMQSRRTNNIAMGRPSPHSLPHDGVKHVLEYFACPVV